MRLFDWSTWFAHWIGMEPCKLTKHHSHSVLVRGHRGPSRRFHARQSLKSYVAGTNPTKSSVFPPKYSSLQYIASFCARFSKDIFSYRCLHNFYGDIEFSFTKLRQQQHSLFSFVANGKHIVVVNGTNPRDRLPV
jgi:hypothetical protein